MLNVPDDLRQRLDQYGQQHVLADWDRLSDDERRGLLDQLHGLDLEQLRTLDAKRDHAFAVPSPESIHPVPVIPMAADDQARQSGEEALRRGEVAVLLVAGGQGSRLGFEHPKGMFPIGPVSNKTLFQIHTEKVLALRQRYGKPLPFLVMTSPATDVETRHVLRRTRQFRTWLPRNWRFSARGRCRRWTGRQAA